VGGCGIWKVYINCGVLHICTYVQTCIHVRGFRIEGLGFSGYPSAARAQDAVVGSGIRV